MMDNNSLFVDFDGQEVPRERRVDLSIHEVGRGLGFSRACVEDIRKEVYATVALYDGVAMFRGIGEHTAKEYNVS